MGTINHNVVIATSFLPEIVDKMKLWYQYLLKEEQSLITISLRTEINGYTTFFCGPDGSKEGWTDSDKGDSLRDRFIQRLEADTFEDGSSPWEWVEIGYGDYGQTVLRGNNTSREKK